VIEKTFSSAISAAILPLPIPKSLPKNFPKIPATPDDLPPSDALQGIAAGGHSARKASLWFRCKSAFLLPLPPPISIWHPATSEVLLHPKGGDGEALFKESALSVGTFLPTF
jgi:hypothetical protein